MKMEILQEFPVSNDQTIAKGKRAKRPRSSSPVSSSGAAAACESRNSSSYSSPTSTEDEEDMANCLILLARANSPPPASAAEENKISTTAGKFGIYVYECKTCYRNFASFQALGGHRASHKKPKPITEADRKKSSPPPDDQEENETRISKLDMDSSLLPNKKCQTNDQIKPKIHECSICGSEFASGQALGGHMRRHRAAPPIATTNRVGAITDNDTSSHDVVEKPRNMLALDFDLNLPALPEDDKFDQFSPKQQPDIVFSAAALVDCHY